MTRARAKFWLCRHNHPMYRNPKTGNWVCYLCNELNLNHTKERKTYCIHGHLRVINTACQVCHAYMRTPWLKELDHNGTARCPRGHSVSHADSSLVFIRGKRSSRRCRICHDTANAKARALAPKPEWGDVCSKGLHPRSEENTKVNSRGERQCRPCWKAASKKSAMERDVKRQKKAGLRPSYVDWVVVERMMNRGTFPYIRRGRHTGPTDGERWVAYCTFLYQSGGRKPEDLYGEQGYEAMQLYQFSSWSGLGEKYKWKNLTLQDIRGMIHTEEYAKGNFLRR